MQNATNEGDSDTGDESGEEDEADDDGDEREPQADEPQQSFDEIEEPSSTASIMTTPAEGGQTSRL